MAEVHLVDGSRYDYSSPVDMLTLARRAAEDWRNTREKTAAERKAARNLVFAFSRLEALLDLDKAPVR